MKKLSIFLIANVIAINIAFSQGAAINTNGAAADGSAMLDVSSTTGGLLIPRMTSAQKVAISNPATGLMIYQTDNPAGFWYYDGVSWMQPIGQQGATGVIGATGATGIQGPTGANGSASPGTNSGDMLYWTGTQWSIVPGGSYGQGLFYCNGVPTWGGCFPIVTTTAISNISTSSATSGGNVTSDGGAAVSARGICYNTLPNPTTANSTVASGSGTGSFSSDMTSLSPGTTYYVRAYATNAAGTAYGNEINFATQAGFVCGTNVSHGYVAGVTPSSDPSFASRAYSTVQAHSSWGGKCWTKMYLGATAEATSATDADAGHAGWYFQFNRKQGYYHDGTTRTPNTTWITSINESSNWTAANDPCTLLLGSTWRLPTSSEYTNFWAASTVNGGMNSSGSKIEAFSSALKLHASGYLDEGIGTPQNRGAAGYPWTSTQSSNTYSYCMYFGSGANVGTFPKPAAPTLRCIKD